MPMPQWQHLSLYS